MKLVAGIVLGVVLLVGIFFVQQRKVNAPGTVRTTASSDCPAEDRPVCGTDGITYANPCSADAKGIATVHPGACQVPSSLNDTERKYLMWLLRQRAEEKLPMVSVFHLKTSTGSCKGCYDLYYRWGSPEVIARVKVEDDTIVSATDTAGHDYVSGTEGEPATFPELKEAVK